jgi:N-acetylmuramoyl-L-alanine amidase
LEILDKENFYSSFISFESEGIQFQMDSICPNCFSPDEAKGSKKLLRIPYATRDKLYLYLQKHTITDSIFDQLWSNKLYTTLETQEVNTKSIVKDSFHIVLDPGHMAATFAEAKIEDKYLELQTPSGTLKLFESLYTHAICTLLKDSLSKHGIKTTVIHPEMGKSLTGKTFVEWLNAHPKKDLDSLYACNILDSIKHARAIRALPMRNPWDIKTLYWTGFNTIDLNIRADRINRLNPDAVVAIHFNVDVENKGWTKTTKQNKTMAFVPGSFTKGEIASKKDFLHFLRLLLSQELINNSIVLSDKIVGQISTDMGIKRAIPQDSIPYLKEYCIFTEHEGVFARNLSHTREIKYPISYVEVLYQDHEQECLRLQACGQTLDAALTCERIQQSAKAIEEGIVNYVRLFSETNTK